MRIRPIAAAGLLALALIMGCGNKEVISYEQRQKEAAGLDPRIANADNAFGASLLSRMTKSEQGGNVVLSPASITTALAMAYNGSAGVTRSEMAKAMGWDGLTDEELNGGKKRLESLLNKPGRGVQLNVANSIWSDKGFSFHKDYIQLIRDRYRAEYRELDMTGPAALDVINRWVSEKTNGKIARFMQQPLSKDDAMLLIDAISFKGSWTKPFDSSATKKESFTRVDGSGKNVSMMARDGFFEYCETEDYQAVRLPFGDEQMAMHVLLPKESASLQGIIERIAAKPALLGEGLHMMKGELRLPRFKAEYGAELNAALEGLGMKQAFDRIKGDFSRMAPTPPNLYIGMVLHKSVIQVDEKGAEAEAATGIKMEAGAAAPPKETFSMTVNRPFLFVIQDMQSGAWLFEGAIRDPESE